MRIYLRLSGELEAYIKSLIRRGLAANKAQAARMLIGWQYQKSLSAGSILVEKPKN
ncbi:Uncharacterised protein [uncultured archaeon]|nr:Uncharacterised protein [uncultured archaeon]